MRDCAGDDVEGGEVGLQTTGLGTQLQEVGMRPSLGSHEGGVVIEVPE